MLNDIPLTVLSICLAIYKRVCGGWGQVAVYELIVMSSNEQAETLQSERNASSVKHFRNPYSQNPCQHGLHKLIYVMKLHEITQ